MSEYVNQIPAERIKNVLELLLRHVTERSGEVIAVQVEEFWSVPSDEVYDIYNTPQQLVIGTISESWHRLEEMLNDDSKVLGYGLVWLSQVLRAIGDDFVA